MTTPAELRAEQTWLLHWNLTNHPPVNAEVGDRMDALTAACVALGERIIALAPPCREQLVALDRLQEVSMWAKAAIARHQPE